MRLKHIFICHAGQDKIAAERLAQNLRNAGHETKVDVYELGLGDDSINFMNEGIENAHTVVILFSKHSKRAKWQKLEISAAVWNEVAQSGGACLVVRLDDTKLPPLLGPKLYGKLDMNDPASLRSLVEEICRKSASNQDEAAIISEALRPGSPNPFRNLRAEYFENRPDLHAQAFASPGGITSALVEMKPCVLEGSRGTGKSMLLLSLRARNYALRHEEERSSMSIFGFYLKLTRGAICNAGMVLPGSTNEWLADSVDSAPLVDIASQEIVIQAIESLISELEYSCQNGMTHDSLKLRELVSVIDRILFDKLPEEATSLTAVLDKLANAHRRIADFIRRRFIYREAATVPFANFDLEQLKRIIGVVRRHVVAVEGAMFALLLDEYENLLPYQQRIVNGLVKLGPPDFSVKIGKKLGAADNSGTPTGQELQEIHDYTRLPLVYDVEDVDQRGQYHDLLRHIVENIFAASGAGKVSLEDLLPLDESPEVEDQKLEREIAKLCKMSVEAFRGLKESKRREKVSYYREAAIYRVLLGGKGRHASKRFCGFKTLAFVSSGVIRYFQEILGVAYHLTYGAKAPGVDGIVLPPAKQSSAVHFVSRHNLTTLSRNVESHGEDLKYFLMDVGDCLRHKLLKHTSEPEAARLTIEDPERLEDDAMGVLKRILGVGMLEGVFQTKEGLGAFKPKHSSDPQPSEFNISRIYAPVLEISPRLRWRTVITCTRLAQLLSKGNRSKAMQHLKVEIVKPRREGGSQDSFQFGD